MNPLTEMFFAPEEVEKLRVVEKIDIARLRELAEAEREGRVVVLPCKWVYERIGDYAYMVDDDEVIEVIVCVIGIGTDGKLYVSVAGNSDEEFYAEITEQEFYSTLFETRAEA